MSTTYTLCQLLRGARRARRPPRGPGAQPRLLPGPGRGTHPGSHVVHQDRAFIRVAKEVGHGQAAAIWSTAAASQAGSCGFTERSFLLFFESSVPDSRFNVPASTASRPR